MLRTTHSVRRLLGAVSVLFIVVSVPVVLGPMNIAAAQGPSCTDTWTNAAGGDWSTASDWNEGTVPTSGDVACITTPGNYTVTISAADGTETVGGLTMGAASGSQILDVQPSATLIAYGTTTDGAGST